MKSTFVAQFKLRNVKLNALLFLTSLYLAGSKTLPSKQWLTFFMVMTVSFEKYHGNGNDFIIVDDKTATFNDSEEFISKLCHRRFGIGADGLMLVRKSDTADFEMLYFNADGKPGTMCGNGGRCIAAFAYSHNLAKEKMTFDAADGLHAAIINESLVQDRLFDVSLQMQPVAEITEHENSYFLNTGSPHHVEFVACVDSVDVVGRGKEIRNSGEYQPGGTNVNFVQIEDGNIFVRTYERGVEDETLSCGTGVTASALAVFLETGMDNLHIKTRGGDFSVAFKRDGNRFTDIWLKGPAQLVFKGEITL